MTMKVVIRTDASSQIGTGHVVRCLTLANALRAAGHEVTFLCRRLTGDLTGRIRDEHGFTVVKLAVTDPVETVLPSLGEINWLVVDHYGLDATWEKQCRPHVRRIMVIDDLADRPHECDLLVDQNLMPNHEEAYRGLVPSACELLLGPRFALLRPEFLEHRARLRPREGSIRRLMVSLGGADPYNATLVVLDGLQDVVKQHELFVDVIVGPANPNPKAIENRCSELGFQYYRNVSDMGQKMCDADLFVGAGGTTTWERLALGLPGVVVSIADNHVALSEHLAREGYQIYLGDSDAIAPSAIGEAVAALCETPQEVHRMSTAGQALVDAEGTQRVCRELETRCLSSV